MVARAAFLRSRKNAACSSRLNRICCRRLVAIRPSLLSRDGQVCRKKALALCEVVRLGAWLGARRPEGEAVEDDDDADLRVRARRHERLHPAATEAEDGQLLEISLVDRSEEGHRSLQIGVHGFV